MVGKGHLGGEEAVVESKGEPELAWGRGQGDNSK